ncbi:MAG: ATP-binding protein [Pseudomonadota bacterium]|nr:ATP-binding protein [Pseudomonadota bacterium]
MLDWLTSKLERKYLLGTASGLLAMSLIFFLLFISMYRAQLESERSKASLQMNKLLQASLENAMLKRDLDGLRGIVSHLGAQLEIDNVMIVNPLGEVRFAARPEMLGLSYPAIGGAREDSTQFTTLDTGEEVLRSVNPVYNKTRCTECHGPVTANPVNGVLVVDYDASILRQHARSTTLALMSAGAIVVLITLIGGWWFLRRHVLRPVNGLLQAHAGFSGGVLDTRIDVSGRDELAELGHSYNRMAETIEGQWRELEGKKRFLQSLIDGVPDGIRVLDRDYRIVLANRAYLEQAGLDQEVALSTTCYRASHARKEPCVPTLTSCPLHEIGRTGQPVKVLHRHTDADGVENSVEIFAAPLRRNGGDEAGGLIVEVIRDLSRTIRYSQHQRLTELGELAAGVAHEIHNPLASIRIAIDAVDRSIGEEGAVNIEQTKEYLKLVEDEIDSVIEVTGRLLKLSAWPGMATQIVEINEVVEETASLLNWEAKAKRISLSMDLPETSPRVLAIDGEMRMVVLNLVQNAYHAMPDGGRLDIRVRPEAGMVVMTFSDTGRGIPEEIQAQIFDPFFSQRADRERGTGLGLAISKGIVNRFDGEIRFDSRAGEGTTFTVTLPDADHGEETA